MHYTHADISAIRRSCKIAARILRTVGERARPGMTTRELDTLARELTAQAKATPAFLGYEGFPTALCASLNDIAVHGIPTTQPLSEGDLLGIDFGVVLDGWYSDVATTVPIGSVGEKERRLLRVTREALERGIAQAKPGNRIGDISAAIQDHVERAGFQVVRELVGHGVGRALHEAPQVPNVGKAGSGPKIEEGMVLAIEPITSFSSQHVRLGRDGFGYKSEDGSRTAHFEHTIAVTERGPEVLTAA